MIFYFIVTLNALACLRVYATAVTWPQQIETGTSMLIQVRSSFWVSRPVRPQYSSYLTSTTKGTTPTMHGPLGCRIWSRSRATATAATQSKLTRQEP